MRGAALIVTVAAVVTAGAILHLTRQFTFFYDEWSFVLGAGHWGPRDFFAPHNEHWTTVPRLAYWVLLHTFGAHDYSPYMAVLMAAHAGSALLLFTLLRRRAGDLPAMGAAFALLLLGTGWEDLAWAFQLSFYGAAFFGLLALVLLEADRPGRLSRAGAAAALVAAVASSGVGLFFVAAAAVQLVAARVRRADLLVLVPAILAYATWFAVVGHSGAGTERNPLTLDALGSLRDYAPSGLGSAVAGLVALDPSWWPLGLVSICALTGALLTRREARPRILGATAGLAAMYVLLSLVRGQYGEVQAGSSRYILIAGIFLLMIVAEAVALLPWRSVWPALVAAIGLVMLVANTNQLLINIHARRDLVLLTAQDVATVNAFTTAPGLDRSARLDPTWMPVVRVGDLLAIETAFGVPVPALDLASHGGPAPSQVDSVLRQIFPLRLTATDDAACSSNLTPSALQDLAVAGRTRLSISDQRAGQVSAWLWAYSDAPGERTDRWKLEPGTRYELVLPDTGTALTWHLRLELPAGAQAAICA